MMHTIFCLLYLLFKFNMFFMNHRFCQLDYYDIFHNFSHYKGAGEEEKLSESYINIPS